MRKLIACLLAVVLAATCMVTAFATAGLPGDTLEIPLSDFVVRVSAGVYDPARDFIGEGAVIGDYTISNGITVPSKSAIEWIKFDDNDNVVIKFKAIYNAKERDMKGVITLKPKSATSNPVKPTFEFNLTGSGYTYGFAVVDVSGDLVFNYTNLGSILADFGDAIGTAQISWGNIPNNNAFLNDPTFYFEVKVNNQGRMHLDYNANVDKRILNAYPDADITFINFPAYPSFDYTGTAKIFSDDPNLFIYENRDGVLYRVNATYDADEESYFWKTRTLGKYVISDQKLTSRTTGASSTTTNTNTSGGVANPNTGANDMVNVAAALLLTSLMAGGALILKKR